MQGNFIRTLTVSLNVKRVNEQKKQINWAELKHCAFQKKCWFKNLGSPLHPSQDALPADNTNLRI